MPQQAGAAGPNWFDAWTRDLARDVTAEDLQRLFTHDTRDAYRFFTRGLDEERLAREPWWRRQMLRVRQVFVAFTLKLSPARRSLYLISLVVALIGVLKLYRQWTAVSVPFGTPFFNITVFAPQWADGTFALLVSILLINLLLLLFNLIIFAIVAAVVRKKALVAPGLCAEHKKRRRNAITVGWVGALGGLVAIFVGAASPLGGFGALIGLVIVIGSIIVGMMYGRIVYAARIDADHVRLKGCGEPFLQSLPNFPG